MAAHNLGIMLRTLFGSGKPRQFASTGPAFFAFSWLFTIYHITSTTAHNLVPQLDKSLTQLTNNLMKLPTTNNKTPTFSTGC
ncbi:MAG: hypothetical protein R3C18_18225 [Planctomycetaceae bacterium]